MVEVTEYVMYSMSLSRVTTLTRDESIEGWMTFKFPSFYYVVSDCSQVTDSAKRLSWWLKSHDMYILYYSDYFRVFFVFASWCDFRLNNKYYSSLGCVRRMVRRALVDRPRLCADFPDCFCIGANSMDQAYGLVNFCIQILHFFFFHLTSSFYNDPWTAEALQYTSAIAVALAVFFILIVIGITCYKMAMGTITEPALFPRVDDFASVWNLFTAVPVLICAYLCHYNGMWWNLHLSSR